LKTEDLLRKIGLPSRDLAELPTWTKRFPDGAQYRIEIPSVERRQRTCCSGMGHGRVGEL
jgi:hypothetical protein